MKALHAPFFCLLALLSCRTAQAYGVADWTNRADIICIASYQSNTFLGFTQRPGRQDASYIANYTAHLIVKELWKGTLSGHTLILKLARRDHDGVQPIYRPFSDSQDYLIFAKRQSSGPEFVGPEIGNAIYVPIDPEEGNGYNGFESALTIGPVTRQVGMQKPLFLKITRQILSGLGAEPVGQYNFSPRKEAFWFLQDFDWLYTDGAKPPPDLPPGTDIKALKALVSSALPKLFQITHGPSDETRLDALLTLAHFQQTAVIPEINRYIQDGLPNSRWLAQNIPVFQHKTPPPVPVDVTATLAFVPHTRRTPRSIPLLLRIRNNTDKPIRLLNLFAQNKLAIATHFELKGPNIGPSGSGLEYRVKAELGRWDYVYITVKPHQTFQTRFDLARMTLDGKVIPPGKYTLSGGYGANEGYSSGMGSGDDVFQGAASIPPIALTIEPE